MKKFLLLLSFLLLVSGAALAWFIPAALLVHPEGEAPSQLITIDSGTGVEPLANVLQDKGIIASSIGFMAYGLFDGNVAKLRPGTYRLQPGMSYRDLVRMFAAGPARNEIEIRLIEGKTIEEEMKVLAERGVSPADFMSFVGDASKKKGFDATLKNEYAFLKQLPAPVTLEGYLFPSTYRVWKDQLPQGLVRKQLDEFAAWQKGAEAEIEKQERGLHEVVTLASIVEKEVAKAEDRKIVAGIFLRRLREGMPLQSDATVNYLTKSGRSRSTLKDLEIDSPYNTYKYRGLPPGPIGNPGRDALEAALHPTDMGYRYFLTDDAGKTYFAKTLEEHVQNRRKAFGE